MKKEEKNLVNNEQGAIGYIVAWLLGVPVVVLVLFKLFFD